MSSKSPSGKMMNNNGQHPDDTHGAAAGEKGGVLTDEMKSQLRLQFMIADQITDLIIVTDLEGKIIYVNEAEKKAQKRGEEEILGRFIHTFGEEAENGASRDEIIETTLENGSWQGVVVHTDKFGKKYKLDSRTFIMNDENGNPVAMCSISTDITEKEKLVNQLRQSQKMEAMGTLTGGIAHDFNNILAIILGNAEFARIRVGPESLFSSHIDQIINACLRGEQIIRQLLHFSRQTKQTRYALSLRPLIKETVKLLRPLIPANIDIRQHYGNDENDALVDPTEIHQVIINLCTNAVQAMSIKGGVIHITLDEVMINENSDTPHEALKPGQYIRLKISDTGDGIAPENLDRIFEPYFTTKEAGAGTGLGLSVVHGIVKDCEGLITVSSQIDEGTTFTILFPMVEAHPVNALIPENSEQPVGDERILFIDDEPNLANVGRQMLEILGYAATSANSARQALEMFVLDPYQFDLVVTDMSMPDITGQELAMEMLKQRPGMPMILCTGYHQHMDEEKAKQIGFKAFLKKPIKIEMLAKTVRMVLDESLNPK